MRCWVCQWIGSWHPWIVYVVLLLAAGVCGALLATVLR